MNLIFKTSDVLRCVKHSLESKDWSCPEGTTPSPGLYLVHDTGVYLMSNANPGDWIVPKEKCYVAYAEGCNPDVDSDYYETSRDMVGGDDFAEIIPINKDWPDLLSQYDEIHIDLTQTSLEVSFSKAA